MFLCPLVIEYVSRFHRTHLEEVKSNGVDASFLVDVATPAPDVMARDLALLAQQQEKLIADITLVQTYKYTASQDSRCFLTTL